MKLESKPRGERDGIHGYGACSGGCLCQGFQGNGNLCENCGHQFGNHN